MGKVILICGKICGGKTTYAKSLIKANSAVLLSTDEITVALYGPDAGDELANEFWGMFEVPSRDDEIDVWIDNYNK